MGIDTNNGMEMGGIMKLKDSKLCLDCEEVFSILRRINNG